MSSAGKNFESTHTQICVCVDSKIYNSLEIFSQLRLSRVSKSFEKTKSLDATIGSFKPPIFWKDKEIVKLQIKNWSYKEVKNLIYQINTVELLVKKHSNSSINILSDFIIEKSSIINN